MHEVAVVLDLVQPSVARRRLVYQARELRLDPFRRPKYVPTTALQHTRHFDSLAQSCGLSPPTFIKERIGIMPRIRCRITPHLANGAACAWSRASIASTRPASRRRKPLDFTTGNCGLFLPLLFERIRTVSMPGKMTPIQITPGPAERPGNRVGVRVGKPSSRPVTRGRCRRGSVRARAGPVG